MNIELEAAVRRLRAVQGGGLVALPDENAAALEADITVVLNALSTPPADDVRDLLIEAIDGCIPDDIPGYRQRYTDKAADRILTAFEVRPRGTVAEVEVEAAARSNHAFQHGGRGSHPDWDLMHKDVRDAYRAEARASLEAARKARS